MHELASLLCFHYNSTLTVDTTCFISVPETLFKMQTLQIIAIILTLSSIATASPGYPSAAYGQVYAQAFPYSFGYSYVTGGYGGPYHPHHSPQPQFGIAKVKLGQNSQGYEYSVKESGPHHHKHVHQTASTGHRLVVPPPPLAVAVPVQQFPYYPQHQQIHVPLQNKNGFSPNYEGYYPGQFVSREIPLSISSPHAHSLPPIVEEYYQAPATPIRVNEGQYFYGGQQVEGYTGNFNHPNQRQAFPYAYGNHDLYSGGIYKK